MQATLISLLASLLLASATAGPSDEMFDELKSAPSQIEAESVADDISAAMQESGSATADLLLERALTAETVEKYDLARQMLDRAIAVQPDFAEAWFQRSLLYLNEDLYDQALFDLNEALTHEPRHFQAWLTLAGLFEALGQPREALEAYREVLKIYPRHETANAQIRRLAPQVDGRSI
ncbi:MAG: hypothetical protein CMK09_09940 [Ponticaulis sp.]|nr:hypothetical protein [Ponticaulis sp.]|tara:strand:+ start:11198 stop:11731 length:534 start_codon:yes stop_codon:yes gene_type:complete